MTYPPELLFNGQERYLSVRLKTRMANMIALLGEWGLINDMIALLGGRGGDK